MIKVSLAVVAIAMSLMAGTALIAGRSGPPAPDNKISDAQMTLDQPPSFVVKPDPKLNRFKQHKLNTFSTLTLDQAVTPADPAVTTAPASPSTQPAATAPKVTPTAAPQEIPTLLSTDLTASHTRSKGGFLDFLRFVISSVARFMANAEDNLFVVMIGVVAILFVATGFWVYQGITEKRNKNKEPGGTGGSCGNGCKTKGPCH